MDKRLEFVRNWLKAKYQKRKKLLQASDIPKSSEEYKDFIHDLYTSNHKILEMMKSEGFSEWEERILNRFWDLLPKVFFETDEKKRENFISEGRLWFHLFLELEGLPQEQKDLRLRWKDLEEEEKSEAVYEQTERS